MAYSTFIPFPKDWIIHLCPTCQMFLFLPFLSLVLSISVFLSELWAPKEPALLAL